MLFISLLVEIYCFRWRRRFIAETTVDALSAGTVYDIWGHYKKGTGLNGVCEVSFATAGGPRPTGENAWAGGTNGHETTNAVSFYIGTKPLDRGTIAVFDNVQIAATDVFAATLVADSHADSYRNINAYRNLDTYSDPDRHNRSAHKCRSLFCNTQWVAQSTRDSDRLF